MSKGQLAFRSACHKPAPGPGTAQKKQTSVTVAEARRSMAQAISALEQSRANSPSVSPAFVKKYSG